MEEWQPSKCKALGSNPSTAKKEQQQETTKLNIFLLYDTAIAIFSIYIKKLKGISKNKQTNKTLNMYIFRNLFIIFKIWKQANHSSEVKWIHKL
jgi:hypothetical protein